METRMDDINSAVQVVGIHICSIVKQFLAIIAAASRADGVWLIVAKQNKKKPSFTTEPANVNIMSGCEKELK